MLTCDEALERMSQALDGPLPLEDRQELEEHLEGCPECRAACEALFQLEDVLRDLGETPAPPELSAGVMARIQAEDAKRSRPLPFWRRAKWRSLAGLAACAVLCIGLYYGAGLQEAASDATVQSAEIVQEDSGSSAPLTRDLPQEQEEETVQEEETSQDAGSPAAFSLPSGGEDAPEAGDGDARSLPPEEEGRETTSQEAETEPAPSQETGTAPAEESALSQEDGSSAEEPALSQAEGSSAEENSLEAQTDQQAYTAESEAPAVTAAAVPPPWGEGAALVLQELPEEAQALLPAQEDWTLEADGVRWCAVTAQELSALQAVLEEAGMEVLLPEQPWTEPCAVVVLPDKELSEVVCSPSSRQ